MCKNDKSVRSTNSTRSDLLVKEQQLLAELGTGSCVRALVANRANEQTAVRWDTLSTCLDLLHLMLFFKVYTGQA